MTTMSPPATNTSSPSLIYTLTGHFNSLTNFVSNKIKSMNTRQTPTSIVSSVSTPSLLSNSTQNFTGGKSYKKHKNVKKTYTKTQKKHKNTKTHKKHIKTQKRKNAKKHTNKD